MSFAAPPLEGEDPRQRSLVLVPARGEPGRAVTVVDALLRGGGVDVLLLDGGDNAFPPAFLHSPRLALISVPQGVGAAVRQGLAYAINNGYGAIARVDGDGQHDPMAVGSLLERLGAGPDMVLGSRYHSHSRLQSAPPADRVLLNVAFRSLVHRLTGLALTDVITGCWAMNRAAAEFLLRRLTVEDYGSTLEMVMLLGLKRTFTLEEMAHPAIYAGGGIESRYTDERLTHRCDRAGVYLKVVADVVQAAGLDPWTLLVAAPIEDTNGLVPGRTHA